MLAGAGGGIKCKNDVINAFDWLGAGPRPVAQIEIVLWRASVNQTVKQRCHGAAAELQNTAGDTAVQCCVELATNLRKGPY